MTVASLVRKTLALNNHRVKTVTERDGKVVVRLDLVRRRHLPCSGCGTFAKVRDRLPERTWRHVPLWAMPVELRYRPARVNCSCCDKIKVEAIPWSVGKSTITREFIVVLATWSRILAWDVVAKLFGVSWSTVVKPVGSAVAYGLNKREPGRLRMIGIDEISRKKGHVYHTQVYDLDTRTLVWSAEGRGKQTIEAFFNSIGPAQSAAIEGICCDMWASYVEVARERAPQATLVFDKFHVVRHLLNAVNDVRKMEAKALRDIDPAGVKPFIHVPLVSIMVNWVVPASINANHVDLDFSNFEVPWSDGRADPNGSSLRSELVRRRHLDPDYHRAALEGLNAGRETRSWETESILAAIREFYSCHRRIPRQDEFRNSNGLPGYSTLWRRFGSGKRAIELALDGDGEGMLDIG